MKFNGILGFDNGIVLAPMGPDIAGSRIVAAVANCGGIGLLATPIAGYDVAVRAIRETKELTDKPFGAGVLLEFDIAQAIKAIFDEKLAVLQVFWGDFPKEMVNEAHKHGLKVMHQVGTIERAEKAIAAGVDCLIVQGVEAGGHVEGTMPLSVILPKVVDMVGARDVAVVAAGGICDGRGYAAALAMGARGVCMGTRFVATEEAHANDYYKQQLTVYGGEQTHLTDLYGRLTWKAPVRCLDTPFHRKWKDTAPPWVENDETQPVVGRTTIWWEDMDLRRFDGRVANPTTVGVLEDMCMLTGMGVGLIHEVLPVAEVMKRIIEETKLIIRCLQVDHITC